jgi:hypothetical protein
VHLDNRTTGIPRKVRGARRQRCVDRAGVGRSATAGRPGLRDRSDVRRRPRDTPQGSTRPPLPTAARGSTRRPRAPAAVMTVAAANYALNPPCSAATRPTDRGGRDRLDMGARARPRAGAGRRAGRARTVRRNPLPAWPYPQTLASGGRQRAGSAMRRYQRVAVCPDPHLRPGPLQSPVCAAHKAPGSRLRGAGLDSPAATTLAGAHGVLRWPLANRPAATLEEGSTVASPQVMALPGDFATALTA